MTVPRRVHAFCPSEGVCAGWRGSTRACPVQFGLLLVSLAQERERCQEVFFPNMNGSCQRSYLDRFRWCVPDRPQEALSAGAGFRCTGTLRSGSVFSPPRTDNASAAFTAVEPPPFCVSSNFMSPQRKEKQENTKITLLAK